MNIYWRAEADYPEAWAEVPLNEEEQRILEEIESQFYEEEVAQTDEESPLYSSRVALTIPMGFLVAGILVVLVFFYVPFTGGAHGLCCYGDSGYLFGTRSAGADEASAEGRPGRERHESKRIRLLAPLSGS